MTPAPAVRDGTPLVRLMQLVLEAPDPAATARFLEDGLTLGCVPQEGGRVDVLTAGPYPSAGVQRILTLVPGSQAQLREVVLQAGPGVEPSRLAERLNGAGATCESVDADSVAGAGIRTHVGGVTLSVRAPLPPPSTGLEPSSVRPRRLGHVNLVTPEPAALVSTLVQGLGLRLSEQVGEEIFFLRIGSEHHNVGVRKGTAAGAHHIALEVHGWDSYRALCDRLAGFGWTVEYGPGRHGPGNNFFVYVRDPSSGIRFELFSDMVHIDDEASYEPRRWRLDERPKTVNVWGPGPPQSFLS